MKPIDLKYEYRKRREKFAFWLARRIPRWLRCAVIADVGAYATTGQYGDTVVPDVTFMEVFKRNEVRAAF